MKYPLMLSFRLTVVYVICRFFALLECFFFQLWPICAFLQGFVVQASLHASLFDSMMWSLFQRGLGLQTPPPVQGGCLGGPSHCSAVPALPPPPSLAFPLVLRLPPRLALSLGRLWVPQRYGFNQRVTFITSESSDHLAVCVCFSVVVIIIT